MQYLFQPLLNIVAFVGTILSALYCQPIPMIVLFVVWVVLIFKDQQSGLSKGLC